MVGSFAFQGCLFVNFYFSRLRCCNPVLLSYRRSSVKPTGGRRHLEIAWIMMGRVLLARTLISSALGDVVLGAS